MILRKAFSFVFVVLLLCLSLTSCLPSKDDGKEVWRFALEEIKGSVQHAYAVKFKELIEKKSQGKIEVKIFPYGTLGTSDQLTELVENGAIHFAHASPGYIGKIIPEVQLFLLHFIFSSNEDINRDLMKPDGPLVELFGSIYRDKGFELLDFYPEGWMAWTTNREIKSPEDFAGVKMRVMTTPLLLASYEAYGADPTPMPYSEVYSGLQLKMIDGQVNPIFAIEEMGFYEVTEHLIFPDHAFFVTSVIANDDFYRNLSPERRDMIDSTVKELSQYIYDVQKDYNKKRLEKIKQESPELNIVHLNEKQRERFRQRAKKVHEMYIEKAGKKGREILEGLKQEIERRERK